jgi:hypothetical protein
MRQDMNFLEKVVRASQTAIEIRVNMAAKLNFDRSPAGLDFYQEPRL